MERKPSFLEIAYKQSPIKDHPIQDIVYLDQNYKTFKYFLTGKFENDEAGNSDRVYKPKEPLSSNGSQDTFLKQLSTLNEKIKLYKSVFYNKSPKKFSYDSVLGSKNLSFNKFKQLKNKGIEASGQHRRHSSFEYDSEKVEPEVTQHGLTKSNSIDVGSYDELNAPWAVKPNSRNNPQLRSRSLNTGQTTIQTQSVLRTKPTSTIRAKPIKQLES